MRTHFAQFELSIHWHWNHGKVLSESTNCKRFALWFVNRITFMSGMWCLPPADIISQVILPLLCVVCWQGQPSPDRMRLSALLGRAAELLTCCRRGPPRAPLRSKHPRSASGRIMPLECQPSRILICQEKQLTLESNFPYKKTVPKLWQMPLLWKSPTILNNNRTPQTEHWLY